MLKDARHMANYRCHVAAITGTKKVAAAKPPRYYCVDDSTRCVKGAKQTMAWNRTSDQTNPCKRRIVGASCR